MFFDKLTEKKKPKHYLQIGGLGVWVSKRIAIPAWKSHDDQEWGSGSYHQAIHYDPKSDWDL